MCLTDYIRVSPQFREDCLHDSVSTIVEICRAIQRETESDFRKTAIYHGRAQVAREILAALDLVLEDYL